MESAANLEQKFLMCSGTMLAGKALLPPAERGQVVDAAAAQLGLVHRCRILVIAELIDITCRTAIQRRPVVAGTVRAVHAVWNVAA